MKLMEKAVQWASAAFMATVVYLISIVLCAFLTVKLMGLQLDVQPPADFKPPIGSAGMYLLVSIPLFIPLAMAIFVGAVTAPFVHRGIAAVVFPILVFAAMVLMTQTSAQHQGRNIATLLEMAASCAALGVVVYVRWWRQQSRIAEA